MSFHVTWILCGNMFRHNSQSLPGRIPKLVNVELSYFELTLVNSNYHQ
jgi:hypothetical protein